MLGTREYAVTTYIAFVEDEQVLHGKSRVLSATVPDSLLADILFMSEALFRRLYAGFYLGQANSAGIFSAE